MLEQNVGSVLLHVSDCQSKAWPLRPQPVLRIR